jgi:hypothetical protein
MDDTKIEKLAMDFFRTANKNEIRFSLGWMTIFKAGFQSSQPNEVKGGVSFIVFENDKVNSILSAALRVLDNEQLIALRDSLIDRTPVQKDEAREAVELLEWVANMEYTYLSDGKWLDGDGKTVFSNDIFNLFKQQKG